MIAVLENLILALFAGLTALVKMGQAGDAKAILAKLEKRRKAFDRKVDDWLATSTAAEDKLFEEAFDDDTEPGATTA